MVRFQIVLLDSYTPVNMKYLQLVNCRVVRGVLCLGLVWNHRNHDTSVYMHYQSLSLHMFATILRASWLCAFGLIFLLTLKGLQCSMKICLHQDLNSRLAAVSYGHIVPWAWSACAGHRQRSVDYKQVQKREQYKRGIGANLIDRQPLSPHDHVESS